jgi:hypothetical protein
LLQREHEAEHAWISSDQALHHEGDCAAPVIFGIRAICMTRDWDASGIDNPCLPSSQVEEQEGFEERRRALVTHFKWQYKKNAVIWVQ